MTSQGYLLDTDYVIDFLKGKDYTRTFLQTALVSPEGEKPSQVRFDISIITYAEVYAGILHAYEPKQQEQAFLSFIKFKTVYPITRSIAKQYAHLRNELASKGQLIDQPDLYRRHCHPSPSYPCDPQPQRLQPYSPSATLSARLITCFTRGAESQEQTAQTACHLDAHSQDYQ